MTEVYWTDIRPLYEEANFAAGFDMLTEERQEKIKRLHGKEEKCRSMAAGLLLEYGLRRRGYSLLEGDARWKKVCLFAGEYGKPYIKDTETIHFNLSHSGIYGAAIFSEEEAGIDIEQVRKGKERIAERFFTEEEAAYINQHEGDAKDLAFTELWTRKESYIKAVGKGMRLPLRDFSVIDGTISFQSWQSPEGYCISVCSKRLPEGDPVFIDLEKRILYNEVDWSK